MKKLLLILSLVCSPLVAQEAKVTPLMEKPLQGFQEKKFRCLRLNILRVVMIRFTGTTRTGSSMCWKAVSSWP